MNFDDIYKQYAKRIFNFCYIHLHDKGLAEDCTQEVFFVLSRKIDTIRPDANIAAWLYSTAKFVLRRCGEKKKDIVSIEEIGDIPDESTENAGIFNDILTEEEYLIMTRYYVDGEDIDKLSAENNTSANTMYQRISRLKNKIRKNVDKIHNFTKK